MGNFWHFVLTVCFATLLANPVCCCAMASPEQPATCCGSQDPGPSDHDCACLADAHRIADENRELLPAATPLDGIAPTELSTPLPWQRAPRVLIPRMDLRLTGPPPLNRLVTCRFLI